MENPVTHEEKILATFEEALRLAADLGYREGDGHYLVSPHDADMVSLMQLKEDMVRLVRNHREEVLREAADAVAQHLDEHIYVKFEMPSHVPYDASKPLFAKPVTSPDGVVAAVRGLTKERAQ
jgi:hypothetical protein